MVVNFTVLPVKAVETKENQVWLMKVKGIGPVEFSLKTPISLAKVPKVYGKK